MARKVFISFLGTNNYLECKYNYNGFISDPVRFVQEALITYYCKEWTENDKILIFCTSKATTGENGAKEINWLDNGHSQVKKKSEQVGLQHRLEDMKTNLGLKPIIEEIDIETGFSENEIWNIFNTVYHQLLPGDQIYFDVTHAFRSIPLFSVVLFNYAKFMIGTQLVSIVYGAFEKLGPVSKVRELPLNERIIPIINLINIARLQEYNQVAGGLRDFGKVRQIGNAIKPEINSESDETISNLRTAIIELDEYINTIDLKKIKSGKYVIRFQNSYKYVKRKKSLVAPIFNIIEELNNEIGDFVGEDSFKNIEAAINWTIKHDMLMQAFPLVEEYIIMRVSYMLKDMKPVSLSSKEFRLFTSSLLGMPDEDFNLKNWKELLARYPDDADDMSEDFLIRELRPDYNQIRIARNSLAHGNGAIEYSNLKKLIPTIIDCMERLNAAYTNYPSTQYIIKNLC